MLNTVGDIITEVLVRNSRNTTDTFITDTIMKSWLQQAHLFATSLHKWPFTEGKSSTTYATTIQDDLGNTIINYPEGWKSDSVRIMTIGGKIMKKMDFASFLRTLENSSSGSTSRMTRRIYSDYSRQFYINTGADVSGSMVVYGQYTPTIDPTDLTATTIFSGYDEEGNEAIVQLMTSYLHTKEGVSAVQVKGKPVSPAIVAEQNAVSILEGIWKRIGDEQFGYQTGDQSMFDYVDVVRGRGSFNNNDVRREDQFN